VIIYKDKIINEGKCHLNRLYNGWIANSCDGDTAVCQNSCDGNTALCQNSFDGDNAISEQL